MPTNALHFTINETYDLNTSVDKLTLLAVRTPTIDIVKKYVNLQNWRKVRFNRCSFRLACVSQLPVDPLGVGTEVGQISPQELVNPILFKTVTGESLGGLLDAIYGTGATHQGYSLKELKVSNVNGDENNALTTYYSLLADDSFRQSHPQVGLTATGMIPLVRNVLSTMPLGQSQGNPIVADSYDTGGVGQNDAVPSFDSTTGNVTGAYAGGARQASNAQMLISGHTVPLPAFDIAPIGAGVYASGSTVRWPFSYVCACVMPPAIQKSLYFRCIVSWSVSLLEFAPNFRFPNYPKYDSPVYQDWIEVPVSASAQAMNTLDGEGLLVGDGLDNVQHVTSQVS